MWLMRSRFRARWDVFYTRKSRVVFAKPSKVRPRKVPATRMVVGRVVAMTTKSGHDVNNHPSIRHSLTRPSCQATVGAAGSTSQAFTLSSTFGNVACVLGRSASQHVHLGSQLCYCYYLIPSKKKVPCVGVLNSRVPHLSRKGCLVQALHEPRHACQVDCWSIALDRSCQAIQHLRLVSFGSEK